MGREVMNWHRHPGVRSGDQLTLGERAADRMRNSMGSWAFVFGALAFLAVWMLVNRNQGFDPYPFILLNLVLSCLAAMRGAIPLIAAKRSDQISSELAQHDYETDCQSEELLSTLRADFGELSRQHAVQSRLLAEALTLLRPTAPQVGTGTAAATTD
jgi:uncharacterized membrane protein